MTKDYRSAGRVLASLAGLVLLAGCHSKQPADARIRGEQFRPEGEERDINRFVETQVASGSRTDAMLRTYHFDHGDLNSLGESKLHSMLKDDEACTPLVIYLDMPQDETYPVRQEAVKTYLKDRGLSEAQVKLEHGPNKSVLTPAAQGMRAKKLIDSGAPVGVNPEPTGSAGATTPPK